MIKAVVFDLDGVYFEGGTEKFIESLVTKYGLSKDAIVAVYLKSEEMQKYKKGEIDSDTFWQYAIKEWNINASRDELVMLLISSYSTNPETVNFVKELKQAGIKTAICTNNFPDRFENLKNKFELDKYFDVIVTSYEEGITKPSDEIFKILSTRLELQPSEIVMSDDREVNVEAVKRLGFEAFLFQGLEGFKNKISELLNPNTDLFSQHFKLLKGTLFTDIVELPTYNLVKGFLTDSIWNYVIPKTTHDLIDFNEIETVVNRHKDERAFSIYVPVELQNDYDKFLLSKGYKLESVDTYIFRKLDSEFALNLEEGETFEEVTDENYEDYLSQAKLAFPEWDNEEHYTNMFYKIGNKFEDKELRNFIIRNAEDIICFGSVIYSKSLNLAYFHNSGTNLKYRRRGYFTKLKGFMCDYIFSQDIDKVYALVEENGGSHKGLGQIGFQVKTKYYIYIQTT